MDEVKSKPLVFHPAVLARARRECNFYLMTQNGQVGNTLMLTVARLKRGQPDPLRTYEMHAELEVRTDTGPIFIPTDCTCPDSKGRGRRCKHACMFCLNMDIPVLGGEVIGQNEYIDKG